MGVIIGLLFFAFAVWYCVRTIQASIKTDRERKRDKKAAELAEQQKREDEQNYLRNTRLGGEKEAERFYRECYKDGAKDSVSAADKERIYLYAKKKNIAGSKEELVNAYIIGQRVVNKEKIEKKIKKEDHDMEELCKYIKYHGRDKLIKYLEDQIAYYTRTVQKWEDAYRQASEAADNMYLATRQKETDWAIAGGIANGIAGPGAGLATAINVQQKNASIQASNASLYESINQIASMSKDKIIKQLVMYEDMLKSYEEALDSIKSCLVEEIDNNRLFACLNCRITETKLSETGAAQVKIKIDQPKDLKIYGDVPALVDGTLKTTIFARGSREEITSCIIGLDYYTVKNRGNHFSVYLRKDTIPDNFIAEVTPVDLWAIEDWQKTKGKKRS